MPQEVVDRALKVKGQHCVVLENGIKIKCRNYLSVAGLGPDHPLGVFNNGVRTVERALLERYFLCAVNGRFEPPLKVRRGAFSGCAELAEFQRGVVRIVAKVATRVTTAQVVQCYSGAKRAAYERANVSLRRTNLSQADSRLTSFAKFEKQDVTKAPRIINPRSLRYNLVLGKWLKLSEKSFYKAINELWGNHTSHTVIKGLNVVESAAVCVSKWGRFEDPVGIGLDATKFDMHVSIEALKWEHSFYVDAFGGDTALANLLRQQLYNRGIAHCKDGKVRFAMNGTRSSGDLNTSLGNCILMCGGIWALVRTLNIDAELMNNGDDCVVFMERHNAARFRAAVDGWFRGLGFRMTVEDTVDVIERVVFCQSSPVNVAGVWMMVRDPLTCLKKDPMCLLPIQSNKVWRKWLYAVGTCGLSLVPGVPVMQAFYGAFKRRGLSAKQSLIDEMVRNTSHKERTFRTECSTTEVAVETRASFHRAFGISPDRQIALEHYYESVRIGLFSQAPVVAEFRAGVPEWLQWAPRNYNDE